MKYNMFSFSNKWRNCICTVIINDDSITYNNINKPLSKKVIDEIKSIEKFGIVQCPFGIFGCNVYTFDENGNIFHK
jgi:hypothetical protein